VELLSSDEGPGISDVALALREGYSTGGGMGCGLPGVQRLMDEFSIQSQPGVGTQVRACKWATVRHGRPEAAR
jgi:serine/threonine-protein kinase RsbT